jgi:hypothetical protein
LKFMLCIMFYILLLYVFHHSVSRWLEVSKRNIFAHDIVNNHHEKADKIMRMLAVLVLITAFIINIALDFDTNRWYLHPSFLIALSLVLCQLLKAYMEWKYIENKREYTYTILEAGLNAVVLGWFFSTGVWILS